MFVGQYAQKGNASISEELVTCDRRHSQNRNALSLLLISSFLSLLLYASLPTLTGPTAPSLTWLLRGGAPTTTTTTGTGNTNETSSWHKYVRSPASRTVSPARVVAGRTVGEVRNPGGLVGAGGVTTLVRERPGRAVEGWPEGVVVWASSCYGGDGAGPGPGGRTYGAGNAVDGDVETFWNDDTLGEYPDVVTVVMEEGVEVEVDGVTVLSNRDGVPVDLRVEVLVVGGDGAWKLGGEVWGNEGVWIRVLFEERVSVTGVRVVVTKAQASGFGEYTRINEVWPGLVDEPALAPSMIVDFGKPVVGFLSISFAGASNNRPGIRLAFAEMLEYLTDVSDFSRSYNGDTITPGSDQIAVLPDPYIWTDTHGCANGSRVCADGLHGFRYVKIYLDSLPGDYPSAEPHGSVSIDGWFECSDSTLNQYWYDAAYTNDICIDTFRKDDTEPRNAASPSLIGKLVLHDGAKRDRDPYVGDLAVAARTLYLTHNASIAAENVLADLADHQRADGWIPPASIGNYGLSLFDYPLWWVVCSCDFLLYTDNQDYFQNYYLTMVKVLDEYYPAATDKIIGLISKGLGGIGAGYGDYAFLPRTGVITYYNALYVLALQNAASIASFYNHSTDADRWTERAHNISVAVNAYLWDNTTGAYLDHINSTTHGQDGNMLAVLSNISTPTRTTSLLSYWSSLALPYGNPFFSNDDLSPGFSTRVYAFISYFEISARFSTPGLADSAIEEIKRLYGWMASHDPGVTFWEGIGENGGYYEGGYTSAAHGWSTGVLPALTNYVLGVVPTKPGFSAWRLKPVMVKGIEWARGVVPTPKGEFIVDWTTTRPDARFRMDIEVPDGTEGEVAVPVTSPSGVVVLVDDVVVWRRGKAVLIDARYGGGYVTFQLSDGKHTIVVAKGGLWSELWSCT